MYDIAPVDKTVGLHVLVLTIVRYPFIEIVLVKSFVKKLVNDSGYLIHLSVISLYQELINGKAIFMNQIRNGVFTLNKTTVGLQEIGKARRILELERRIGDVPADIILSKVDILTYHIAKLLDHGRIYHAAAYIFTIVFLCIADILCEQAFGLLQPLVLIGDGFIDLGEIFGVELRHGLLKLRFDIRKLTLGQLYLVLFGIIKRAGTLRCYIEDTLKILSIIHCAVKVIVKVFILRKSKHEVKFGHLEVPGSHNDGIVLVFHTAREAAGQQHCGKNHSDKS